MYLTTDIPALQAEMRVLKSISSRGDALKSSSKTPSGSLPTMDAFVNGFAAFLEDNEEGNC